MPSTGGSRHSGARPVAKVTIGSLAAPVLVLGALYLAERGGQWAGYLGVLGGYLAGLLAARYDVGIERPGGGGG